MARPTPLAALALSPLALLALGACSGGSGSAGPAPASADVLLSDAPADDLAYLRAEVTSAVLERADGTLTPNLLDAPVSVDVLHLDGLFRWLASPVLEPGTYAAVRLGFDPLGFEAADQQGTPVMIVVQGDVLRAELAEPVTLAPGEYRRFTADFDLDASLAGAVSDGTLYLAPGGAALATAGGEPLEVDDFLGIVQSADAAASGFVVDAFVDGDMLVPLGEVRVHVVPETALVDEDGSAFASPDAFFASLSPGGTVLEIDGALRDGAVTARVVTVVYDPDGIVAELRGRVVEVDDAAGEFELLVQHVLKGEPLVDLVLGALGDPNPIRVAVLDETVLTFEDGEPAGAAALTVGQEVDVRFRQFAGEPFPASAIEIAEAEYAGVIVSVDGLPDTIEVELEPWHPAIACGEVDSGDTDVTVELEDAQLWLHVIGKPGLAPDDLVIGLEVLVKGALSGPSDDPTIDATSVRVRPGWVDGADVVGFDAAADSFTTIGGFFKGPFGGDTVPGPLRVTLEPDCYFQASVKSESAFYDLLEAKPTEVRVQGIGTGAPGEVRAFLVKAKKQTPGGGPPSSN